MSNFTKFIEWPPEAFPSPNAAIKLCILGEDPFGDDLEQTIQRKRVNGRAVVVQHFRGCFENHSVLLARRRTMSRIIASFKRHSLVWTFRS